MGFLQRIFGAVSGPKAMANTVYAKLMEQSRLPQFYGEGRLPDSYDGRIDILSAHMAVFMANVQAKEKQAGVISGKNNENSFSQLVFDVMVKDFDVALREEGFTDTGVKRRIKPIIGFFYKRLKTLTESLGSGDVLKAAILEGPIDKTAEAFAGQLADYVMAFNNDLENTSLDDLVNGAFTFPDF